MASGVSTFVVKMLCENQGCLDFASLNERLGQRFTVHESVLRDVLHDDSRFAVRYGPERALGSSSLMSPDSLLVAKTSLRLCQRRRGECAHCDRLHLCRYLVCGYCKFGIKCKNYHDLASPYNMALLTQLGLQDLTEKQLFQLLLQNDSYLLPEICPHYNKGNGEHGSCKFASSCTNLHLCQHFVLGDCRFGSSCKRAHTKDADAMRIFNGRGFSPENVQIFDKIYKNKSIILGVKTTPASSAVAVVRDSTRNPAASSRRPTTSSAGSACPITDPARNEICLYFIRGHCSFKERCVRVHFNLPYKWQVMERDGVSWKDLPNMEEIEKAYCDPKQNTSYITNTPVLSQFLALRSSKTSAASESINFLTMTYGGYPVRRLSTASSVAKPLHFILTTEWLWYWKDDSNMWVEYSLEGNNDGLPSITSQTLEKVYLEERKTEFPFTADKQQYILYIKEMYQQNTRFKTKREVRRRPRFVSAQEVELRLKRRGSVSSDGSSAAEVVPPNWDKNFLPSFSYKLVPLTVSMSEYKMVEKLFKNTMQQSVIHSIKRIQNPSLWKVFQWQKEQMRERNGGKPVDERYLFHGTAESLIDAICEQNFDWRICGVNGTSYGRGSYFARDAVYSDGYIRAASPNYKMIVALVLVGDYTTGCSSYVQPPAKGTNKGLYDSCVNSASNPSVFVIFEKFQVYPYYIIEYQRNLKVKTKR
ncbi:protein mono-ADP-ribosyltransferase PARP12 [Lampris incognitus]|uniref:protein mono-ADP-ribosyltransferase PARP12 n=1 Tax=Lampris incognitus TaxID=2546036 RepID=UPI0024B5B30A|nr:protein mono-ADP-ribosyltransferase PARP12 [Lampris incognitus]